jgi:hypothetical protein
MTMLSSNEGSEVMDQQEDSGEQTDSGISSTFTTDIEQMFADTVNNVGAIRRAIKRTVVLFSFAVSCQ